MTKATGAASSHAARKGPAVRHSCRSRALGTIRILENQRTWFKQACCDATDRSRDQVRGVVPRWDCASPTWSTWHLHFMLGGLIHSDTRRSYSGPDAPIHRSQHWRVVVNGSAGTPPRIERSVDFSVIGQPGDTPIQ